MKTQDVYIKEYDWNLRVYYNTVYEDTCEILTYLYDTCYDLTAIDRLTNSGIIGRVDCGATISNGDTKSSVIILSKASDSQELFNTMIHELKHLVDFISVENGLRLTGENTAYLIGDIGALLFPAAGKYLCGN